MVTEDFTKKPLPSITDIDREFWDGVNNNKLVVQKCLDCNTLQFFPRPVCVHCFGEKLGWQEVKGTGKVYSFTIVTVPRSPAFRKQVEQTGAPIIFAAIDLDEGIRMMSQIVDCKPGDVQIGSKVKAIFEQVEGTDFKVPKFRLEK